MKGHWIFKWRSQIVERKVWAGEINLGGSHTDGVKAQRLVKITKGVSLDTELEEAEGLSPGVLQLWGIGDRERERWSKETKKE